MKLKVILPDEDRKSVFEEMVEPFLIAADENNAVDNWMFNLTKDGQVDMRSAFYVSSQHMKIFIVHRPKEREIPYYERSDYAGPRIVGKRDPISARIRRAHKVPKLSVKRNGASRPIQLEEKWATGLECWDISNGQYKYFSTGIQSPDKTPSLETLCEIVDFDLWLNHKLPEWFLSEDASNLLTEKEEKT